MRARTSKLLKNTGLLGSSLVLGAFAWGCSGDPEEDVGEGLDGTGTGARGGSTGTGGTSASGGSKSGGSGGSIVVSGGTSSSGGTGGSSASGGTGSGASAGSGGACVDTSREGTRAVVALYFMIDISGSMKCAVPEEDPEEPCETDPGEPYSDRNRWTDSSAALTSFFQSPQSNGLWAGIQFFPGRDECSADAYADPASEIAELPGSSQGLVTAIQSLGAHDPAGYTPTVPSLEGATQHARDWAEEHTDHQAVVVYLTDGYPKGNCSGNSIDNAADVAQAAFSGSPSIRTYVLGVGPNLDDLNSIAVAGGTEAAFFVDTGADVTGQLTAALASIREDVVVDCTYTIPAPPAGQTLDLEKVNVKYTNGDGETVQIGYNGTTGSCDEGWQFAENNTQVVLCGATCDEVKADPEARIDVAFGCNRMPFEPR
ncbi:MAG TPA: vWA domain-containing protein [Polyangiaceae bacterium]